MLVLHSETFLTFTDATPRGTEYQTQYILACVDKFSPAPYVHDRIDTLDMNKMNSGGNDRSQNIARCVDVSQGGVTNFILHTHTLTISLSLLAKQLCSLSHLALKQAYLRSAE